MLHIATQQNKFYAVILVFLDDVIPDLLLRILPGDDTANFFSGHHLG